MQDTPFLLNRQKYLFIEMILEYFKANFPQLQGKWQHFASYYHRLEVPAQTSLLQEGHIAQKAFLIEKGCIRACFNNNGKDITFQFFFENEFAASGESFRNNTPSFFTLETIEPSVLHCIYKKDLNNLVSELNQVPEWSATLGNIVVERQWQYINQLLSFIRDTPQQRYLNLLVEKPHIVQRVPLQYIATYLGITPVSLSRIRKRVGR